MVKFDPCQIKLELRRQEQIREICSPSRCYEEAVDRSRKLWTQYEQINRDFCPDDPVYTITRAGIALSTTADFMDWVVAVAGQLRILEIIIGGEATASAVNRIGLNRGSATVTTTPAGISTVTPEKVNTRSPAAAGSYGSGATATLATNSLQVWAFNAFGAFFRWMAGPGEEIYMFGDGTNKEWVGLRSLSGTSTCSGTTFFEEL